jgi:hypothetical protein
MNYHINTHSVLCLLIGITAVSGSASHAEPTPLVNYQGKLKRNGTNENGQIGVTFRVFTGATNNECIYEESQQVTVVDGLYSTLIGQNPTLGTIENAYKLDEACLEVSINGTALKPREKFTPPPFSQRATETWRTFASPTQHSYPPGLCAFAIMSQVAIFGGYTNQVALFPPSRRALTVTGARFKGDVRNYVKPGGDLILEVRTLACETNSGTLRVLSQPFTLSNSITNAWQDFSLVSNKQALDLQPSESLCVNFVNTNGPIGVWYLMFEVDVK